MKKVNIIDLAKIISDNVVEIGIRPGEELSEDLISEEELPYTNVSNDYIFIFNKEDKSLDNLPHILNSNNAEKMKNSELSQLVKNVKEDLENKYLYY